MRNMCEKTFQCCMMGLLGSSVFGALAVNKHVKPKRLD